MAKKSAYTLKLEKELKESHRIRERLECDKRYLMIGLDIVRYDPKMEDLIRELSIAHYDHQHTKEDLKRANEGMNFFAKEMGDLRRINLELTIDLMKLRQERRSVPTLHSSMPAIDQTMWRRMMQLCHPDKHGNNEASNIATKWLLENR